MRKWLALILLLGAGSLPSTVHAQFTSPGHYYPQAYGYPNPYAYQPAAGYPAINYYYSQPMTRYQPTYAPGMPVYPAQQPAWQPVSGSQDRHVILAPIPTTLPVPASRGVIAPKSKEQTVRQVEKKTATPVESAAPEGPIVEAPGNLPPPVTSVFPSVNTSATQSPDAPKAPVTLSEVQEGRKCRVIVFGDYLYWNVHGVDVPFAQPFDGIDPIFSVPRGPVAVVSPQFSSGFRVGGGASICDRAWVVGTFTYFDSQRSAQATAGDGLVLHNFLAFPNTNNAAVDSLTASADYTIRLWMADIDGKLAICSGDRFCLNWLAGARYAHLDQNLSSTFQLTGVTTVDSSINFDGIGPRLGLEGQYHIHGGFYGYATGIVDVLFGQFRGSYEQRNINTGLVGLTSINANRTVPILELELGGGWQSHNGCIRLSGGYYVGSWYNTMTTTSLAGAIGNVNFTTNGDNFRDNLVFDGFVARIEFRY